MKRQWTDDELEAHFTLHAPERDLVGDSKTDHNLLGLAGLLKYFQYEGVQSHRNYLSAKGTETHAFFVQQALPANDPGPSQASGILLEQ